MSSDSDEHLVRYLLGDVPEEEAVRLDERSVVDDEFAFRLRALENDLVDRYVRGERFDASLERFDRMYGQSPYLREKVRFAEALNSLAVDAGSSGSGMRVEPTPAVFWLRGLAAAAVLLLVTAGYLAVRNQQLGRDLAQLESRRVAIEREQRDLQQRLERQRTTASQPRPLTTATFLLPAPRRGLATNTTTVSIPRGSDRVALRLQTEADAYETFWATLKDPVTGRSVWRSGDLAAEGRGADRIVAVTVRAELLLAQRYIVELSGIDRSGMTEPIGHYVMQVVLE